MKLLLLILIFIYFSSYSICQIHFGLGFNYPISLSPKRIIYDETSLNDSIRYSKIIKKDNFNNITFPVFLETKIYKNVICKLEYKYLTNSYSIKYLNTPFGYVELNDKFSLNNLSFQVIIDRTLSKSNKLSFGFGITTLFSGKYINEINIIDFLADTIVYKYSKGANLGIKSSLSYVRDVSKNISIFCSMNFELATWKPKEYELTKYVIRGVDLLSTLSSKLIKGRLMDECDNRNIDSNYGCRLPIFVNYEQVSFTMGIKYRIL